MGSPLAHQNEAPMSIVLADFLIRTFCRPGGVVCDPFCGSGTTLRAAVSVGRRGIAGDLRRSQVDLTRRRMAEVNVTRNER